MNKNPHRSRRRLSIIGVSLLIATGAACGSDSESDTSEAISDVSSAVSTEISSAASTVDTIGESDDTDGTVGTVDSTGMDTVPAATASDDREAIIEYLSNIASSAGIELDNGCVSDLVDQLSDEDAAKLGDSARAGGEGDPELSAEGEAIGTQIEGCADIDTATTMG